MASSDTPQSQTPDGVGTTFTQTVTVQEADTVAAEITARVNELKAEEAA